ncbi:ESAT-6 protein secretion system EspG family protein [Pseudonocardia kunmingensis]|uniref:ESAT-6 protein secretion system EspG family protein n=1 Tax=Pseudonocardia kunmingensis TaxID=630975 RepID=A0A543E1A1_9PSEU|nr:ESAT-6 protein secretion system EspG family protein [Pseudonocardia kunmingensis]
MNRAHGAGAAPTVPSVTEPVPVLDTRRHALTAVEFDVLWEWLGLGPTPVVLQIPSPGRSHAERRSVQADAWRGMRERGLAGSDGPAAELVRLLHLLARPTEQMELRAVWEQEVRVLGAARAGVAALGHRAGSTVTISACGSLPSAVVAAFPPAVRGPGRACTAPTAVLTGVPVADARPALLRRGIPAAEVSLLVRMLTGVDRRAQVVALAADRWGVLRRAGGVLGVLDGPRGRYLLTRSTGDDGTEWATVAPADARELRHRVTQLLATANAAAAG